MLPKEPATTSYEYVKEVVSASEALMVMTVGVPSADNVYELLTFATVGGVLGLVNVVDVDVVFVPSVTLNVAVKDPESDSPTLGVMTNVLSVC